MWKNKARIGKEEEGKCKNAAWDRNEVWPLTDFQDSHQVAPSSKDSLVAFQDVLKDRFGPKSCYHGVERISWGPYSFLFMCKMWKIQKDKVSEYLLH